MPASIMARRTINRELQVYYQYKAIAAKPHRSIKYMLLIGIDWADDHHDAAFMSETGELLAEFRFSHDQDGFDQLHARIEQYEKAPGQVQVAIETKHGLLVHDLLRSGFTVYALNPKAVNRYKDRLRSASTKDDKLDARTMANILRTDRDLHRPIQLSTDDYRLLERLCKDLQLVIGDISRLSNRLHDSLKEWHPAVLGIFGLDSNIFLELVAEYLTPGDVERATQDEFCRFLKKHKYSVPGKAETAFLQLTRRTPKADPVAISAGKLKAKGAVEQLRVLYSARKEYELDIRNILDKLPEADIISSLPGVGKRLAPEITAMFGPNLKDAPKRFEQAKDISDLAGASPVTKQSGKFKCVNVRYACDRYMRSIVRNWAGCSINNSRWAKAYYDWHRKMSESHETILRKLASKWIKIAFHLWKTGERYNEQIHIAALKQRNVIWAASL
jgi:transposase